jgi:hypothetical protein
MKIRHNLRAAIALLALTLCGPAVGQIFGNTVSARSLQLADQVKQEREDARFRLGAVRLMPYLTLKDVGYNNNVFSNDAGEKVADYTATVAPGARLLVPFGQKIVLRAGAEPAYYWWKDLTYLRGWGITGDGQVLGLFNRLTVGATGRYADTLQLVNSEANVRTRQKQSSGDAALEVEVLRRLSVFGTYEAVQTRLDDSGFGQQPGQGLSQILDRTEYGARGGVRYRFDTRFSVAAMGQWSRAQFVNEPVDRNNEGFGALVSVRYDRARFYVELTGGYQQAKGTYEQGNFPEYRTETYTYFVSYFVARKVELQVSGWRRPQYSYYLDNPYYFETRNGAALNFSLGHRVMLGGSFSLGTNAYPVEVLAGSTLLTRRDDVETVGGTLGFVLSPTMNLAVNVRNDRYTSNIPGVGRSVLTVSGGVNWNFGMLRVGAGALTR